jgi:hypothetical protein
VKCNILKANWYNVVITAISKNKEPDEGSFKNSGQ